MNAADGTRVWSQSYDREMGGVLVLQEEIAGEVARALRARLVGSAKQASTVPEAYRQYQIAMQVIRAPTGAADDSMRIRRALEQAVTLDPTFARAWARLATTGARTARRDPDPRARDMALQKARDAAARAIELAPEEGDGYSARGYVRMAFDYNWAGAKADLDKAIQLNPSDGLTTARLGLVHSALGELPEAVRMYQRAVDLDPLSASLSADLADLRLASGDHEGAKVAARRAAEIAPRYVRADVQMAVALLLQGQVDTVLELARRDENEDTRLYLTALASRSAGQDPAVGGAADRFLERFGEQRPVQAANVAAWLGRSDEAFRWLDRALQSGFLSGNGVGAVRNSPLLRALHSDPRWADLLRKMNLPVDGESRPTPPAEAAAPPSIAVLPFADMSPKHDQEYFADGVAEEILNALAQVRGLKVIGRTSSFSFKGKSDDLRAIGRKLNAEAILEGSVRKDGGRLRITAKLIRAEDGTQLWSQVFDRGQARVFAVQEEIARAVTAALRVKLLPGEDLAARWTRTDRPEVYSQFLLATAVLRRGTVEDFRRALATYEKALALDPGYAPAWAGVADSGMGVLAYDREDPVIRKKVLAAADKAVALAPDLPNGYVARAEAKINLLFDSAGAAADLARARTLSPDAGGARFTRTRELGAAGSAMNEIPFRRRAIETDPLNPGAWVHLGLAYAAVDDLVHAREALGRALEIAPGHSMATMHLCNSLVAGGQPAEALALAAQSTIDWLRLTCTALAQNDLGHPQESRAALDALIARFADYSAYQVAQVYAWRGDGDRAFEWLERAYAGRDMGLRGTRNDPLFRKLRGDPRWKDFLGKLRLSVE